MAVLSSDGKYVTVEKGDTLSQIAVDYAGGYSKYKQLAAINNIPNPDRIYVGQKIYLTKDGAPGTGGSSTSSNKPTINQFGLVSNADNLLFATWSWNKSNTESYKVLWTYDTGNGVWFEGSNTTITVDSDAPELSRQSTYTVPSNARRVQFKVKPISKKKTVNNKETSYWEANWSDVKTYTDATPIETPPIPTVTIEKYKLTATLDNLDIDATGIEFEIVKDNAAKSYNTGKATIVTGHVSYSCSVDAGSEYKVRARAYKGSDYSDWSGYSSNEGTMPAVPSGITSIKATSKTSIYLEWAAVKTAKTYDIEYTTKKSYFDGSNQTTTQSVAEGTHFEMTGLETGHEYFFRVRAVNDDGSSAWCEPKSVKIGDDPAAPTTWSSTTTAITGEQLNLYWVHNASDGSSQTHAELELDISGAKYTYTLNDKVVDNSVISYIPLSEEDREAGKTNSVLVKTSGYTEGTKILWRVRTAGVTLVYGEWSVQRTVDIYAPPTLTLDAPSMVQAFPITIKATAGPPTQAPISYHVSIVSNELYETVDNTGNPLVVNRGDEVYSRHFDISTPLDLTLSAGDIDLENNVTYTLTCTVAMNSGLTADASKPFGVTWTDELYTPNAEISVDPDTYTASIRPYCEKYSYVNRVLEYSYGRYTPTGETISSVYGEVVPGAATSFGQPVYRGVTVDGDEVFYYVSEVVEYAKGVTLSVYRREFDGTFTEIATGLKNEMFATTVIDPHPSLDYARYRVVAISEDTGAVSFYDPPGYPVGGIGIVIQWDEQWSSFETNEAPALEQPPWSGSLLKLPYNVDISDSVKRDVALIEYIGRQNPVAYHGTQVGDTSTWNTVIDREDKETLYTLRRLAKWMGNVYVREPSGSGYWASINVSYSLKHRDVTIPVTFDVTRVEGGV